MLRTGIFITSTGVEYNVCWFVDDLSTAERIDIFTDAKEYNIIDTSGCTASYIHKNKKEFVLGNHDLIKEFKEVITAEHLIKPKCDIDTEFNSEGIVITETKVKEEMAFKSVLQMVNGVIRLQEVHLNNRLVSLTANSSVEPIMFLNPISLKQYISIGIFDGVDDYNGGVEYRSLAELKAMFDLDHIEDYDFVVASSMEEAVKRLHELRDSDAKLISIDIETTGLDIWAEGTDYLTGIVLSYESKEYNSTYYPFRQSNCDYNLPLEFIKEIIDVVNNRPKDVKLCAYMSKMEYQGLWKEGYDVTVDLDGYILSKIQNTEDVKRGTHSLKGWADKITKLKWLELKEIFKTKDIRFDVLPEDIIKYYACPDGPNTITVCKYLLDQLPKEQVWQSETETKLIKIKAQQEFYGIRLDMDKLNKDLSEEVSIVQRLSDEFKRIHRTSKNIQSHQVLTDIVYGELGCPVKVLTKKGSPSTSAKAIEAIVTKGKIKEPTAEVNDLIVNGKVIIKGSELASNKYFSLVILKEFNTRKKRVSELEGLIKKSRNGRMSLRIDNVGAASMRQTSNAHQFSSGMKELVLSDTSDHTLSSTDYMQVELRVLAFLAGDSKLIELMKNKFVDIHRAFLSIITGKPIHLISAKQRGDGKRVNFGVVYGISEYGLAIDIFGVDYTKEQLDYCKTAIMDFYNAFPKIKQFVKHNNDFIKNNGYITTKWGSRRHFSRVLGSDDRKFIAAMCRAGNNTPVQGFAAYLMKLAEINIYEYIKKKGWDKLVQVGPYKAPLVRLMLSIHDEVLVSSHESIPLEELILMLKECMEIEIEGAPPFFATPSFLKNWAETKKAEYELPVSYRDEIIDNYVNKGLTGKLKIETFVEDLNKFKLQTVAVYMDSLIAKYKTKEKVLEHLDHPEHTHSLISICAGKEAKSLTHEEAMALAVTNFMDDREKYMKGVVLASSEKVEDEALKNSFDIDTMLELEYEIDEETGALVKPDLENDEADDVYTLLDEELAEEAVIKKDTKGAGVIYSLAQIILDVNNIKFPKYTEDFLETLRALHERDGDYKLYLWKDSDFIPTGVRVNFKKGMLEQIIKDFETRS